MSTWTELLKAGGKATGAFLWSNRGHAIGFAKGTFRVTKGTVEFASKHPKTTVAATAVALPAFGHKEGLLNFAKDKFLGKEEKSKGLVDSAATLLLGEQKDENGKEKSVVAKTLDTALGDGSYSSLKGGVENVGGVVGDVYSGVKNTVSGLGNEVGNLYQDGKQLVGGWFDGNGMVANGNGTYYDPTSPQYPNMNQMGLQQGGLTTSLMGGMNNAVNAISGGNISKMNLAGLLLSAYMMFGRFGWLGKAASMMLGGMTLRNINNHQQVNQMQQGTGLSTASSAYQQQLKTLEQQSGGDEDVVVRSRGL